MEKDVRIDTEEKGFKYRVCGIVLQDDKILLQKAKNDNFYFLPGGHVELGEDTKTAVIREMKEETENEYIIDSLIAINENFFKHGTKKFHELGFYYKMHSKKEMDTNNYSRDEMDKGELKKLTFEWIKINSLNEIDFRPNFIKNKIMNKSFEFEHIITNEI